MMELIKKNKKKTKHGDNGDNGLIDIPMQTLNHKNSGAQANDMMQNYQE